MQISKILLASAAVLLATGTISSAQVLRDYFGPGNPAIQPNGFPNLSGGTPDTPPTGGTNLSTFEIPVNENVSNNADRLTSEFIPAVTGAYTFAMASDDGGMVYLSTDSTAANAVQIISQTNAWTGSRQYNEESNAPAAGNFSAAIPLIAGNEYFIEGLHQQGGGGSNFAVTASTGGAAAIPDGTVPLGDPSIATTVGTLTSVVPEPTTVVGVAGGIAVLLGLRRRRA